MFYKIFRDLKFFSLNLPYWSCLRSLDGYKTHMWYGLVIKPRSNVAIMLILRPWNSTSNVVIYLERLNRFTWELSSICSQYISNISAFQIKQCFRSDGPRWQTPFMKGFITGDSDNVEYTFKVIADAKALRASVIELYWHPFS